MPAGLTPFAEAVAWIERECGRLGAERVPVGEACGRVLAAEASAADEMPPADRALEPGWALRAEETLGAGAYNPLAMAAVRVAEGAPLPPGTDAVVPADAVQPRPDGTVELIEPVSPGALVERRGDDFRRGAVLLRQGRRLRPADLGLLAAGGIAEIEVVRRPRVRLIAPAPLAPMLRALVMRDGGLPEGDTAAAPDLVLAAGDADAQATLAIRGVALRPGTGIGLGRLAAAPLFRLPGLPAACLWAYEMLAGRAVRRIGGGCAALPYSSRELAAGRKIVSAIGLVEIWPVRRVSPDTVEPVAGAAPEAPGLSATTAEADGFVVIPAQSEGVAPGMRLRVYLYDAKNA